MTTATPTSTDGLDDAALARAAASGDRIAFGAIYDRYADRLHDFCIGMLRDRDAAADCVQDVFVIAATKLVQLREPDRLRSWLYAIARSEALSRIRHRRREQPSEELPEMASGEPDLATLAARNELADLINDACGGLSDRDRTVLELSYHQNLAGPELADALGVTHKNANNLVERLRDTIARSLGALLVCRRVKSDPTRCPELAALIDEWDGEFTVLLRKRTARHIDGCPVCEIERARMVTPAALLGATPITIPAPAWLRESTLSQATLPGGPTAATDESWWPQSDFDTTDLDDTSAAPSASREPPSPANGTTRRNARAGLGAGLVLLGIAGGVLLATPTSIRMVPTDAPGDVVTTAPSAATTPSQAQKRAPTSTPPVAPPATPVLTSAPDVAPPVTDNTPTEPTAVPRTQPPPNDDAQEPDRSVPEPQNPEPEPTNTEPAPKKVPPPPPKAEVPDEEGPTGPSEPPAPPNKPTLPNPKPSTPKDASPDECLPNTPCDPLKGPFA